jgi:hypothetical protein
VDARRVDPCQARVLPDRFSVMHVRFVARDVTVPHTVAQAEAWILQFDSK